jgi:hypothetical protein
MSFTVCGSKPVPLKNPYYGPDGVPAPPPPPPPSTALVPAADRSQLSRARRQTVETVAPALNFWAAAPSAVSRQNLNWSLRA